MVSEMMPPLLSYPAEKEVLVTTDLLMEGVCISTLCMYRSSIWGINRP